MESSQLMNFREKELKLIQVKDKLFDTFCAFLNNEIRLTIRQEQNVGRIIKSWFTELLPTTYETCVLAAVEEQWAGFLSKLDDGIIKCADAEEECNKLIQKLKKDFQNQDLIKNPYHYISIANDILVNEWNLQSSSKRIKRALGFFKKAIDLEARHQQEIHKKLKLSSEADKKDQNTQDIEVMKQNDEAAEHCSGAAHVGVAWCLTLLKEGENYSYKGDALASLKSAQNCLVNEMSVLNAVQLLLERKQPGFSNSDLYKQLNIKATILGSYIRGVNRGIDAINRSKRLIDVVTVKEEHEKTKESQKRTIKHFNELERNEKEKSKFLNNKDLKLRSSGNSLIFNDLTKSEDSGAHDQALVTVANAYDEALLPQKSRLSSAKAKVFSGDGLECLPADYKDVAIGLRDVDLARIQEDIFYSDKEYKDLTRELAIAKLKEQRTYKHSACRYLNSCKANMRISSIDDQKINNVYHDQEINELIEIVTDVSPSDTALRFNLEFKGANVNSINKELQGSMKATSLKVSFDNLDKEGAKAKVESIKASTFDVEFVTNKASLLKLLKDDVHLKSGILSTNPRNQVFEEVDRRTLLQQVDELKSDEAPCFVKFTNLSHSHTAGIINSCHEKAMFNICFNNVHNYGANELKEGPVNFCFEELGKKEAAMVIKVLREKNFEFSLQFNRLSDKQVRFILQCATLDQEHMKVTKVKNVSELFMAQLLPKLELNEFISKGMEYIIEINEELFIPWRSVCVVAVLGAGQVVAGGALMVTGFGGSLGLSLVTEGIADTFVAYRAYSTRQFRWSDYALQKVVSLALSAATLGFSNWKDAAKGIKTVATGVGEEVLEQAATQIVTNKKVVAQTLKATGQNLKRLTCKVTGTKIAEAAARETLNAGVQALSNLCLESLKPDICLSVQSSVRRSFDNPELKGLLYKMHAIDVITKSSQLQAKVQQIVAETINPQRDLMKKMWNSVGLPLLKGTLADSGRYASTVSMGIRIIGTLNGLKEMLTLTDAVVEALIKKLRSVDRSCMTIGLVLHTRLKINKEEAKLIAKSLKDMAIFDEFDNLEQPHEEVGAKIDKLKSRKNPESLSQEWAVERKDVEKRIQHQLVNEGQNSESQKADQEKYDELSKKESLTEEEKEFMSSYGKYRTFLEQYNYNSRDYCIAYSQSEMAHYAAKQDEDGQKEAPAAKTVSETVDSVRKGSPADLATMIATAKMNGVNLKAVDNKDYVLTEEDKANGVQVVYVEQGKNNQIGHAYYMDSTSEQFVEAESTGNDCFYAAFSKILEAKGKNKSVADLRSEVAKHMESNAVNFSKVVAAQDWIRQRHPESSNNLLFTAGLHKDKGTGKLKLDPGDLEALEEDLKKGKRGGRYRGNFQPHEEVGAKIDKLKSRKNPESLSQEWAVEKKDVEKVISFLQGFHAEFGNIEIDTFSEMMKSVSDQIAEQLIRIMDSQLLQPWSTLAVSGLTDALSKRIQHHLVDEGQNSESQKADQEKYDELSKKESLTEEEKEFMSSYGKYRTFLEQYNYNSRDYCIAYSQSEMAYYAAKQDEDGQKEAPAAKTVSETVDSVRKGSPADLATMIATAKMNAVNLKVVDNKDYVLTEEDKANGVQVVYVEQGKNNHIGHAYYMDSTSEQFVEAESTGNDCFYAVFSKILETKGINKSAADLRAEVVKHMESNAMNFSKVVAAQDWIRQAHPESSNNLLFTAGLHKDKETGKLKLDPGDVEALEQDLDPNNTTRSNRGGKYSKNFKRLIPREDEENEVEVEIGDTTETVKLDQTLHHIISNETVEACTLDSIGRDPQGTSELLEELINRPGTRDVIERRLAGQPDGLMRGEEVGQLLHAAVSWNPSNVVRGPDPRYRVEDPHQITPPDHYDREILRHQPQEYQDAVTEFETTLTTPTTSTTPAFKQYVNLPRPEPVQWELDYKFYLCYVPTDFFESREKLDSLFADEWQSSEPDDNVLGPSVDKIPFTEVLERFQVKMWFVEEASNPDVPAADDERLQKSLFDLFGPADGDEDGRVSFRNFRQLSFTGKDMYGTAERGDCFFVFYYKAG
ncbi:unnamed protein product [Cyprideis torosa]|uniref:Uncharacterized protein n=1 Tax=Cyprideis torosa TaxID=163714 RepID=A0A7R8WF35_9CRUS|nr:unnamed protein product [Cyprideis torosa]CAG0896392.1 unnamed protein product [Cyprideis torosa]